MEQILTSKKIFERNLSIVKHINDKYVLFKDEKKITVDNGNPNVSSVYGVTTIDQLMHVSGDEVENEDEYNIKFITCKYLPNEEEYNEFFYSNICSYYSWYDKILDKWFSKCKKEVTD